jgi:hypothetical protein
VTQPLVTVPGPTPTPYGYGLYSVAPPVDSASPRVTMGAQWPVLGCGHAEPLALNCAAQTAPASLVGDEGLPWALAYPFAVVAGVRCKPVGATVQEMRDEARNIMRLSEQWATERGYWRGGVWGPAITDPSWLSADPTVLHATPVSPKAAIGMLEDAITGMTGGVGVIHAPRMALGVLGGDMQLRQQGGRLMTLVDTPVVMGGGYDGTGPDGTRADGEAWVYATGPVQVVRSPVVDLPTDPAMAVDRATNDTLVMAVRNVAVGHACGVAGLRIQLA